MQYNNQSSFISALQGGVGKTTSTFLMASHFAHKNPGTRVLVVDMCPQANVSSALLGKTSYVYNVLNQPDCSLRLLERISSKYFWRQL